jgi:hypothetical protein
MMTDPKVMDARQPLHELAEAGLAERIEGQIVRRACGRIRDLRVVCEAGHITIKGRSRTYHARQLALQAAIDLAGGGAVLADQIVVC